MAEKRLQYRTSMTFAALTCRAATDSDGVKRSNLLLTITVYIFVVNRFKLCLHVRAKATKRLYNRKKKKCDTDVLLYRSSYTIFGTTFRFVRINIFVLLFCWFFPLLFFYFILSNVKVQKRKNLWEKRNHPYR